MPNIKSAAKRDQLAKLRNMKNKARKSELKTNIKKFDAAIAAGETEGAKAAYKVAVKTIDSAVSKGLLHKNNAAHKKSRLTIQLNSVTK